MVMGVFSFALVALDQFNIESVFSLKSENNAPVCPHRHRPEAPQPALEPMQAITAEVAA